MPVYEPRKQVKGLLAPTLRSRREEVRRHGGHDHVGLYGYRHHRDPSAVQRTLLDALHQGLGPHQDPAVAAALAMVWHVGIRPSPDPLIGGHLSGK